MNPNFTIADQMQTFGVGMDIGNLIANNKFTPGHARPIFDAKTGLSYVTVFSGGDPKNPQNYRNVPLNNAATLREDEWRELDAAVLEASRDRLSAWNYFTETAGLVKNIGNAMGTTVYSYEDVNDPGQAIMTMDGVTRSQNDAIKYTTKYIPLPIIHMDYELNVRTLSASRMNPGTALDNTMARVAARRVAEFLEDLLFTTSGTNNLYQYGGGTIYSFLNHPSRNLKTLQHAWTASSATGATILADVLDMQAKLNAAYRFGEYVLLIPTAYEEVMSEDFKASSDKTIAQRLMDIRRLKDIIVCDRLTGNNVVMVELSQETFRVLNGLGITTVQESGAYNMLVRNKVMTIQVPQIRADQNGRCGVVHGSA